jgi:hypothetical protein
MQRHSLLGGYPKHDALPLFLMIFSKNCVEIDRTSESFFGWKPDLVRSKGDCLRGVRRCCSFKDPSTYASAATARILASTVRVLRSAPDLFSKAFE